MDIFKKTIKEIEKNDFSALGQLGGVNDRRLSSQIHGQHPGEGEKDYHLQSIAYQEGVKNSEKISKKYLKDIYTDTGGY